LTSHTPIEVAVALIWRGDELLITRRVANVHLGGLWELPGGKCEPGEAPSACAVREVREELGIEVEPVRARRIIEHRYQDRTVRLHAYDCRYVAGDPGALGCVTWRWVGVGELERYEFPAANRALLAELRCSGPFPAGEETAA
jgi:mutator protein MutT